MTMKGVIIQYMNNTKWQGQLLSINPEQEEVTLGWEKLMEGMRGKLAFENNKRFG